MWNHTSNLCIDPLVTDHHSVPARYQTLHTLFHLFLRINLLLPNLLNRKLNSWIICKKFKLRSGNAKVWPLSTTARLKKSEDFAAPNGLKSRAMRKS